MVAPMLPQRAAEDHLPEPFVASFKTVGRHSLRRTDGANSVLRIGEQERPKLAAEEAGGVERLQLFLYAEELKKLGIDFAAS